MGQGGSDTQTFTDQRSETRAEDSAPLLLRSRNTYQYLLGLSVTVLLSLLKQTDGAGAHGACKAFGVGQNGCDGRNDGFLLHISVRDLPPLQLSEKKPHQ